MRADSFLLNHNRQTLLELLARAYDFDGLDDVHKIRRLLEIALPRAGEARR